MIESLLYPSYRELYRYNPVFARKKVIEVYRLTRKQSLTASIVKTNRCVVREILRRYERGESRGYRTVHGDPSILLVAPLFILRVSSLRRGGRSGMVGRE